MPTLTRSCPRKRGQRFGHGGSEASADPKAARIAELTGSMKAFNASKGYALSTRA
jgi:hypothetical protein